MKPVVHVIDQASYNVGEIQAKAKAVLEEEQIKVRGKSVFLKPSFVYPARPPLNRGINTQPEFVAGIARALKDLGASKIWVAEDCLVGPSESGFLAMGVLPYLRGVAEPIYLADEERVDVKVADALIENSFRMPKRLMYADVFISLPKLKVNMYATVTLSVKNHIGLLLAHDRLSNHHYNIHKKIADLYQTRLPDFVFTDAIIAGQGQGPMQADPAELGVMLAGKNGVAVDAVSCRLMGYEPKEVAHLVYLHEKNLGPIDFSEIDIRSSDLLAARSQKLARPITDFSDFDPSVRFCIGSELACVEGCVGMIRGSLDRWAQIKRLDRLKGWTFITGKPVAQIPQDLNPRKTIVVGDCAAEHKHLGDFIPGCPVPPMEITYRLSRKGVFGPLNARLRDLGWGMLAHALKIPVR
jgi:uncharacterized protein (DUF362 family)